MTWQTLSLFFVSTFFVSATPGSNMLYAFQMGLNHGLKKSLWVMAGLSLGLLILMGLALVALGVIAKYPMILTAIKLVGAMYLVYLGVQSWQASSKLTNKKQQLSQTPLKLLQGGMYVSLSNPKAILFFSAFFPKFINFNAPLMSQYVWLIVAFFISETFWQLIYTTGGMQLSNWLNTGNRMLYLNRLCGVIFMGIGTLLMTESVQEFF